MRSRRGHADEHTERYPVMADEPVEVRNPRRKARMIAASFAATIVLTGTTAYAGATYAIDRAESDLRRSRDQFAADLEQRRKERDQEQAAMGRDLCTVVTRLPADPETDAMRRKYGCGPFVPAGQNPPPSTAPGPASRPTGGGTSGSAAHRPPARPNTNPGTTSGPAASVQGLPTQRLPTQGLPTQGPPPQGPPVRPVLPAYPPDQSEYPGIVLHVCLPLLGCVL
jgi:hypothetical protein